MSDKWTTWLWNGAQDVYSAILAHPFIEGLTDGSLIEERFAYFVVQDSHYLRDYARALALVAAKAPTHADAGTLARHAADAVDVELTLHENLMPHLGIEPDVMTKMAVSPTTRAYTSYLISTAYSGTFAEGLSAVLPCYWIYSEWARTSSREGSPDSRYQLWIDTYAGEEFRRTVDDVLALADRVGQDLPGTEAWRTLEHFTTTARYEWMFWDAAWRQESWPV